MVYIIKEENDTVSTGLVWCEDRLTLIVILAHNLILKNSMKLLYVEVSN